MSQETNLAAWRQPVEDLPSARAVIERQLNRRMAEQGEALRILPEVQLQLEFTSEEPRMAIVKEGDL